MPALSIGNSVLPFLIPYSEHRLWQGERRILTLVSATQLYDGMACLISSVLHSSETNVSMFTIAASFM